jgi:uncharacterized protein YjbI with pentapeptide repeats
MRAPQSVSAENRNSLKSKLIKISTAALIVTGCSSSDAESQLPANSPSTTSSVVTSSPRMEIQPGANVSGQDLSGRNISCNDLYAVDLTGTNLTGANLSGSNLKSANLYDTVMAGADLYGALFEGSYDRETMPTAMGPRSLNFSGAYFGPHLSDLPCSPLRVSTGQTYSEIAMVSWPLADFSEADIAGLEISNVDFGAAKFSNINNRKDARRDSCSILRQGGDRLCFLRITDSNFASADFSNSYLWLMVYESNFMGVDFSNLRSPEGSSFLESDLTIAKFVNADLSNSTFKNVNAGGADFYGADLAGAEFNNVSLIGANFMGADLTGAKFVNFPDLQGATMPDGTLFDGDFGRFTNPE